MPKRISWHHRHEDHASKEATTQIQEGRLGGHRVTRFLKDTVAELANRIAKIATLCLRWLFGKVAWERKRPFRDYFNFSWKKALPSHAADWQKSEEGFASRYSGNNALHVARRNYQASHQFLKEVACDYPDADRQAVETLVAHRRNLEEMTYLLRKAPPELRNARTKEVVQNIQKRCDALSTPHSSQIVHVKDSEGGDYTSFTFPGGHRKHYLTFEVQFHPAGGDYYFIIHNRGDGHSDKDLHGKLGIRTLDGSIYKRTSVKLKVTLEQLKDPELLGGLYQKMWSSKNIKDTYKIIKKHLLKMDPVTKRPLNIVMSPQETKWIAYLDKLKKCDKVLEKYAQAENLTKEDKENLAKAKSEKKHLQHRIKALQAFLVSKDPAFHSIQSFGTCTESNSSSPEKSIVSAAVRRELKLFTMDQLAQELSSLIFLNKEQQSHRKLALEHYQERSEQLMQKIKAA